MCACMHTCMQVRACACVPVCVRVHMHAYTHLQVCMSSCKCTCTGNRTGRGFIYIYICLEMFSRSVQTICGKEPSVLSCSMAQQVTSYIVFNEAYYKT